MQQMLNSMPSRKIHIPLCDAFLNINAEEEFLLRKKLEEQPIDVLVKKYIFTLVFFMVALSSIAGLFYSYMFKESSTIFSSPFKLIGFLAVVLLTIISMLLIHELSKFMLDLFEENYFKNFSREQRKAIDFLNSVDNVSEEFFRIKNIKKIKESLVHYNNYHNKLNGLNEIVSPDKANLHLRKYILAQVLINLTEEDVARSYVKDAADYFIATPVEKLEFSPREDVVFNIESKAYGKAISPLAKKYQSSISDFNTSFLARR